MIDCPCGGRIVIAGEDDDTGTCDSCGASPDWYHCRSCYGEGKIQPMRVLVACEFSGIVRDAFAALGHDAWSCDLLPTERPGNHIQGDVLDVLSNGWNLMIAHPPCTYLCTAGYHYSVHNPERMKLTDKAEDFFYRLYNAPIIRVAVENPVGVISTRFRKPDQIIEPYMFGHSERKRTCLWLRGLPILLSVTNIPVKPIKTIIRKTGAMAGQPYNYYWRQQKSSHERSRTFQGIADAMADQWGGKVGDPCPSCSGTGIATNRVAELAAVKASLKR